MIEAGETYEGLEAVYDAFTKMHIGTIFTEWDGIGRKHTVMKVFEGRALFDNGHYITVPYNGVEDETVITVVSVPNPPDPNVDETAIQLIPYRGEHV